MLQKKLTDSMQVCYAYYVIINKLGVCLSGQEDQTQRFYRFVNRFLFMEDIYELVKQCGLGIIKGKIYPVSGGFMHKMFRVQTTAGTYAVKCLNPEIMSRPDAMRNYAEAERLERVLESKGIPVVAALSFDGKKMITVNIGLP